MKRYDLETSDSLSTHPDIAALPLFACGGKRGFFLCPLSSEAEERAVQRSVDRASHLCTM
jgi:hypothetical protein